MNGQPLCCPQKLQTTEGFRNKSLVPTSFISGKIRLQQTFNEMNVAIVLVSFLVSLHLEAYWRLVHGRTKLSAMDPENNRDKTWEN